MNLNSVFLFVIAAVLTIIPNFFFTKYTYAFDGAGPCDGHVAEADCGNYEAGTPCITTIGSWCGGSNFCSAGNVHNALKVCSGTSCVNAADNFPQHDTCEQLPATNPYTQCGGTCAGTALGSDYLLSVTVSGGGCPIGDNACQSLTYSCENLGNNCGNGCAADCVVCEAYQADLACTTTDVTRSNGDCTTRTQAANAPAYQADLACTTTDVTRSNGDCTTRTQAANAPAAGTPPACRTSGGSVPDGACGTTTYTANCTTACNGDICVTAPDFSISATPATQSIVPGQNADYTVTLTALNGFTDSAKTITLTTPTLPTGTRSSFSSDGTTFTATGTGYNVTMAIGASSLSRTLRISSAQVGATQAITVTGTNTALSLSHPATVTLTVVAPGTPAAPTVSTTLTCIASGYTGSGFTVSWTNSGVTWVDVDTDSGFALNYYHKTVSSVTSTTAPSGFNLYCGPTTCSGALSFNPATTYYVRTYNEIQNSSVGTFTTPSSCAAFDYSLSNSGGITVNQGSSGSNTITRTLIAGTSEGVTLSASGLPSGATASFTNNPSNPTSSSTLTISTLSTTPAGSSTITVTGSPLAKTTSFTLTVNSGGGSLPWIQTFGGDVHSNTNINTPGGPGP